MLLNIETAQLKVESLAFSWTLSQICSSSAFIYLLRRWSFWHKSSVVAMVLILASKLPRSEKEWVFVLFASYASMQDYIYCIFLLFHWSVLSSGNTKRWITLSSLFQGKTFWRIKVGEACGSIQAKETSLLAVFQITA